MPIPTVAALQAGLAPYWLYLKIGLYALLAAALVAVGFKTGASLTESRWLRAQAKQAADYQRTLANAREAERQSYAKSQAASETYQDNLAKLDASYRAALGRIGAVRVCVASTRPAGVPATGSAPGRPDAAHDGADVPATAGSHPDRDIGPDLVLLARDADVCRARLTALQGWAAGQ